MGRRTVVTSGTGRVAITAGVFMRDLIATVIQFDISRQKGIGKWDPLYYRSLMPVLAVALTIGRREEH
jgi:hypothetical protein